MNDWNIQSRAHACQACGKAFVDKQSYHTLLFDEKRDFTRLDICHECWQGQFSQGATERKGFVSYWQGTYEAPVTAPEPIQKENAESVLRKIIEVQEEKYAAAGFILAVMLERKRILKVKEQLVHEGRRVFIYEHSRTNDVFSIADPNLQLDQLEEVQREVAQLLEHGFNPSIESVSPPPAVAEPASDAASPQGEPVQG
jgi:hypothetical protein